MKASMFRQPLPSNLISFSSPEGKTIFSEALAKGGLDPFFPIIEQFHTQSEPAFCGLGTLTMTLNALGLDPNRLWKGPWRWFSEELLDCCVPLEQVKKQGITIAEFKCVASCNGADCQVCYASDVSVQQFREAVQEWTENFSDKAQFLVVCFDRATLNQTGSGHFSPIGGYHKEKDLLLVLDVARFKHPPYWVPLELLFQSLLPEDKIAKKSRGFMFVSKKNMPMPLFFSLLSHRFNSLKALYQNLQDQLAQVLQMPKEEDDSEILHRFEQVFTTFPILEQIWKPIMELFQEYMTAVTTLLEQATHTMTFKIMSEKTKKTGIQLWHDKYDIDLVMCTILFLAIPKQYLSQSLLNIQKTDLAMFKELREEVLAITVQIDALTELCCVDSCTCKPRKIK